MSPFSIPEYYKCFRKISSVLLLLTIHISVAQVGIGTTTPDTSSMLDISSTSQGLLAPRMTTSQRNAITTPANSLLVYDTDARAFYYYDTISTNWIKINAESNERDNYKLIKSAADLATELSNGGGSKYMLTSNTYYEINGLINLAFPIDLNNAYISGLDANEDILEFSGTVFEGATGGNIRNITIRGGGTVFNINGPGISSTETILFQNTIVDGMASIGSIKNIGLLFSNTINYTGNMGGITYSNIGNLLLNNQGWLGNNAGTYETLTGAFGLVEKVSGFSMVNGGSVGLDVSDSPTVGNGVIIGTAFSGTSTEYVKRYTMGSYPNFNFSNAWTVDCPGIPKESDDEASGNLYYISSLPVTFNSTTPMKLPVVTEALRLFRTEAQSTSDNSLIYKGKKDRFISVFASVSFTATKDTRLGFSIYKNGALVTGTESIIDVIETGQRQSTSIIGTVSVDVDDDIEIWMRKISLGNETFLTTGYNLIID